MKIETKCLHEGYTPKNGEPQVLPIYQSTTYNYESSDHIGKLFDLTEDGFFYSRLANPTVDAVEKKIAALEGGVGALMTSSGQAANMIAIMNIAKAGDHILAASTIYGGTLNLLAVTMKRFGYDVTFVDADAPLEVLQSEIRENTKAVFGETLANPALCVLDFEKFAALAHQNNIPFIVDNTFATPVLCKPFTFGADIITHSTTKYMDGHAQTLGGVIVDSGNFNWSNGKFPEFTEPDESYHGIIYTEHFGNQAYIQKARAQLLRDIGATPSAINAFMLNTGLETLPLRMERHSSNALAVAEFLEAQPMIESVNYPGLASSPYHALAEKYLPNGTSGVISFTIKGGREAAVSLIDHLQLASNAVHVAGIRTMVLHPASSTHRQLSNEQLIAAGVNPGMIRFSVGLEHIDDILEDLSSALSKVF